MDGIASEVQASRMDAQEEAPRVFTLAPGVENQLRADVSVVTPDANGLVKPILDHERFRH
jgi:hypothetical protein